MLKGNVDQYHITVTSDMVMKFWGRLETQLTPFPITREKYYMSITTGSVEGVGKWMDCLGFHINTLIKNKELVSSSKLEKVEKLYPLYASIIEDSISLNILLENSKTNQSYIISRALLERIINFCYLQYSSNDEYQSYINYTKNKAARSLNRSLNVNKKERCSLKYANGRYDLPQGFKEAVDKFTSNNGREIPRWTNMNIDKRAEFLDSMTGQNLFIHIMMIYGDASEALHGTLYGSLFHLGVYNIGSVPHDQDSLIENTCEVKSFLCFMATSAIQSVLYCLTDKSVINKICYTRSNDSFMKTCADTNLTSTP